MEGRCNGVGRVEVGGRRIVELSCLHGTAAMILGEME